MSQSLETRKVTLEDVTVWMPTRPREAESGANGRVLIVGGGWREHGAPVLAALSALYAGVDEVTIAVPEKISSPVRCYSLDYNVIPMPDYRLTKGAARRLLKLVHDVDAALIGAGLQKGGVEGAEILAQELAVRGVKLLLSSEGSRPEVLRHVPGRPFVASYSRRSFKENFRSVPSETEKIEEIVAKTASSIKGVVLLKGPIDVVSDGKTVYVNTTGSPLMTVKSAGAILEGLAVGLMARGLDPLRAAATAAYLAGLAGERTASKLGFHAGGTDILSELKGILAKFDLVEVSPKPESGARQQLG